MITLQHFSTSALTPSKGNYFLAGLSQHVISTSTCRTGVSDKGNNPWWVCMRSIDRTRLACHYPLRRFPAKALKKLFARHSCCPFLCRQFSSSMLLNCCAQLFLWLCLCSFHQCTWNQRICAAFLLLLHYIIRLCVLFPMLQL